MRQFSENWKDCSTRDHTRKLIQSQKRRAKNTFKSVIQWMSGSMSEKEIDNNRYEKETYVREL